jgi:hypothetical protein
MQKDADGNWVRGKYGTFNPMSFASKEKRLPDALASRSIMIPLQKLTPDQALRMEKYRSLAMKDELGRLHKKIEHWERSLSKEALWYDMAAMDPRRADTWRPLFAVAALAGPAWVERAKNALHQEPTQEKGPKVRLLVDIQRVFDELRVQEISTEKLIEKLCEGDSEWNEMPPYGKPLSGTLLGRMLKPLGIVPTRMYLKTRSGEQVRQVRGYARAQFEDTWRTL